MILYYSYYFFYLTYLLTYFIITFTCTTVYACACFVVAGRLERSDSLDSLRLSESHDSDVAQMSVSQTTTPRRQRQLQQQQQMRAEEDAWLIPESVVIDADGTTFQQQVRQLLTRHEKVMMRRALSQFRETGYRLHQYEYVALILLPRPRYCRDGVLFSIDFFVCFFLYLFLCQQDYEKTAGPICMKFSGKVWIDHGTT